MCVIVNVFHFGRKGQHTLSAVIVALHILYMHSTWCLYLFFDNIYITDPTLHHVLLHRNLTVCLSIKCVAALYVKKREMKQLQKQFRSSIP